MVLYNIVMSKDSDSNEAAGHNATITARPRIFFRGKPHEFDEVIGVTRLTEFTNAYATPGTTEYNEMEQSMTAIDRNRLRALRLLRYVHAESDELAAKKALGDAGRLLFDDPQFQSVFAGAKRPRKAAQVVYSSYFTDEIKGARLAIHRTNRGEFIPVVRCPDMKTAMFVFAAFRGIETCLNCQKLFAVDAERPDGSSSERYCTGACGQRYRQKLYRLRQKSQATRSVRKEKRR